jgi:hypothetical protein
VRDLVKRSELGGGEARFNVLRPGIYSLKTEVRDREANAMGRYLVHVVNLGNYDTSGK